MQRHARIAVLGAGYVGSALARAARKRGDDVWAVRRTPRSGKEDGVHWISGDLTAGRIHELPDQLDAVVLTVAPGGAGDYDATYPPAAQAAVALARASGARSLVYTSSTGVYGGRDGEWVTEASERRGAGPGNDALRAAEDIVMTSGLPRSTVLRVAGIYGPGRDPRPRMMDAALLPERGEYWSNLAHREDIIAGILHTIGLREAPLVMNLSDGAPTLAADVARWLATQRGEDPDMLVFGNDAQRSRNNQRVSNARLVGTGWTPRYPTYREGFAHGL
ncbi:MAG TPA: NAD(P)H-binding protein [Gemmatimonas sp.]|nr:NAD(P)H-binding protein [Gemmatimonas sp.]